MAIVTPGGAYPIDFRLLDVSGILSGTASVKTSTSLIVDYGGGSRDEFTGVGFTFGSGAEPTGGIITGYKQYISGALVGSVEGASASATQFMTFVKAGDTVGAVLFVLSGHDLINGSAFADYLAGGNGSDAISGAGGDDQLIGNSGNDLLDGGAGTDAAIYGAVAANFTLTRTATGWTVHDKIGPFGTDTLINVEAIWFTDKSVNLGLTDSAADAYGLNLLRTTGSNGLSVLVANGLTTRADALASTIALAGSTTSVATLSYQFFTGKIPSQGGIDYLVSPTGPNVNNLNSAYYQSFSLENRYINFAVNLGKVGEGSVKFTTDYGGLSLFDATKKAYATIFGVTPADAKVHALLDPSFVLAGQTMTRAEYFGYYGGDGANGIGTKAAMVGWLLGEAVKADVGMYAKSNDAFLTDLADGAAFAVDLVGVYGKAEYANL